MISNIDQKILARIPRWTKYLKENGVVTCVFLITYSMDKDKIESYKKYDSGIHSGNRHIEKVECISTKRSVLSKMLTTIDFKNELISRFINQKASRKNAEIDITKFYSRHNLLFVEISNIKNTNTITNIFEHKKNGEQQWITL